MESPYFKKLKNSLQKSFHEVQKIPLSGQTANYIPELSKVEPNYFSVSIVDLNNNSASFGHFKTNFSIQSISKVFSLSLCLQKYGEKIFSRVNREPSGNPFNSLIQLETENGIPRNPFINAGALVICDILLSFLDEPKEQYLKFLRKISNNEHIHYNSQVYQSEKKHLHRNAALCHFMKSYKNIFNKVEQVLDFYFFQCSIEMNTFDLAQSFKYLANHGQCINSQETLLSLSQTKRLNALLLSCGLYDEAGDFAYKVGLPAKSGVGGGIVALLPQKFCICSYSPLFNSQGNSIKGLKLLETFTSYSQESIF